MTPLRYGERFILGYESAAQGPGRYYVAPRGMGGAKKASWHPSGEGGWAAAWREFESREPGSAADYRRQLAVPSTRAQSAPAVPLLTIPTIPGREITQVLGLITASAVMSRNAVSDFGSEITSVFGGNLTGIEKAISACTQQVQQRMYLHAQSVGADAVVGMSVRLESVSDKAQAVLMAGTAVKSSPVQS